MELQAYVEVLKRRWRIAASVALVVICLGALGSMLISPKYQAKTTLRMETPIGGSSSGTNYETTFANRLTNTYTQIATSEQLMNELKEKLEVRALPDVQVSLIPDSEIIQILVESNSPSLAAKAANTLADILVSYQDNSVSNIDSQELSLLEQRVESLKTELAGYQQQHDQLAQNYSETTAELSVLQRRITLTEGTYQSLRAQNAPASQIDPVVKEWNSLQSQFKDLSVKSNNYLQQITLLRLSIQSAQSTYSNLLDQNDAAQLAHLRQENAQKIIIVSPAVEPLEPSSPGRLFVLGLSLILGIIAGIFAAFIFDSIDPHIYSPEQIEILTPVPVLGTISKSSHAVQTGNRDPIVERDYLILRARLQTLIQEGAARKILVTSPNRLEGKSTLTYKLALGLSQHGHKVLLVDADMRTGKQHRFFEVTGEQGLSEFLGGQQKELKRSILRDVRPGIDLLPSPLQSDDPIELLESPRLKTLLDAFNGYDVILFDSPAVLAVPDTLFLSQIVDGVVLTVRAGHTKGSDIQTSCQYLASVGANLLGIVVNETPVRRDASAYQLKTGHQQTKKAIVSST